MKFWRGMNYQVISKQGQYESEPILALFIIKKTKNLAFNNSSPFQITNKLNNQLFYWPLAIQMHIWF